MTPPIQSVVASPAGAIFLAAFNCGFDEFGRVVCPCIGIDWAPMVPAPAGKFVGIPGDLDKLGLGETFVRSPGEQFRTILGDGWRHVIGADGEEPRVVPLIRPEDSDLRSLVGAVLLVCHEFTPVSGRTDRMADGGAESTQVDDRASGGL